MTFRFFAVPVCNYGSAADELNSFLLSHRILSVDRRWIDEGTGSFWVICVDYYVVANTHRPTAKVLWQLSFTIPSAEPLPHRMKNTAVELADCW